MTSRPRVPFGFQKRSDRLAEVPIRAKLRVSSMQFRQSCGRRQDLSIFPVNLYNKSDVKILKEGSVRLAYSNEYVRSDGGCICSIWRELLEADFETEVLPGRRDLTKSDP